MDDFSIADLTGLRLDRAGAERLLQLFRTQAQGIARFSEAELKAVEPPLRSLPMEEQGVRSEEWGVGSGEWGVGSEGGSPGSAAPRGLRTED
jgi:hypothetical protein